MRSLLLTALLVTAPLIGLVSPSEARAWWPGRSQGPATATLRVGQPPARAEPPPNRGEPPPNRGEPRPARAEPRPTPVTPEPKEILSVQSEYQKMHEDAWRDVVGKAQQEVASAMQRHYPWIVWGPALDLYVQRHLVAGETKEEVRDFASSGNVQVGEMRRITLRVELTQRHVRDMLQIARRDLSVERLGLAAAALLPSLLFLLAVSGFVYADRWTKGYFTHWLSLGACLLVGLACLYAVWILRAASFADPR